MKKMTAILAVLIAAVMVMGMTASAEANSSDEMRKAAMEDRDNVYSASAYGDCYVLTEGTYGEAEGLAVSGGVYVIEYNDLAKIYDARTENIVLKTYSIGGHGTVNHGSKDNLKNQDYTYSVNTGVKY